MTAMPGNDRATVAVARDDALWISPVDDPDLDASFLPVAVAGSGPADLLVHEESEDFSELRQLHRRGLLHDEHLVVDARSGSLEPQLAGSVAQLRQLRALGRLARRHVPELASWPSPTIEERP